MQFVIVIGRGFTEVHILEKVKLVLCPSPDSLWNCVSLGS